MALRCIVGTSASFDGGVIWQRGFYYHSLLKDVSPEDPFTKGDVPLASWSRVLVSNMKPLRIPAEAGEFIKATLCCTVSTVRHFLHLAGSEEMLARIEMTAEKAAISGKLRVAINPEKGTLVLAKNNEHYSRAVVIAKSNFDSTSVFFVDYGNNATVDPETIFIIEDEFLLKTPPQAFCVDLQYVEHRDISEEEYRMLRDFKNVSVQINGVSNDGTAFLVNMLFIKGDGQVMSVAEAFKQMTVTPNRVESEQGTVGLRQISIDVKDVTRPDVSETKLVTNPCTLSYNVNAPDDNAATSYRRTTSVGGPVSTFRAESDWASSTSRRFSERRNAPVECFFCGQVGHMKRDCPRNRKFARDVPQNRMKCYSPNGSRELDFSSKIAPSQPRQFKQPSRDPYEVFPFMREIMEKAREEKRKKATATITAASGGCEASVSSFSNGGYARANSRSPKRHVAGERRTQRSDSSNDNEKHTGSWSDDWSDVGANDK